MSERIKPPVKRVPRFVSGQRLTADALNEMAREINRGNAALPSQKRIVKGTGGGVGSGTTVIYAGYIRFFSG